MRLSQRQTALGQESVGLACGPGTGQFGGGRPCGRLAVVLLGAGLVSGCGDSSGPGVSRLTPRGVPFLEGVPAPQGFRLVDDMVMDHESAGQRMARHEYRGHADPHGVRNFYREQMPLMGWDRVSDQNFKGVITIRFEKACKVEIRSAGALISRTVVKILVVPFNRTPLQPPKQPVP